MTHYEEIRKAHEGKCPNRIVEGLLDSPNRNPSLTALARAVSGESPPKSPRRPLSQWIGAIAVTGAAAILSLLLTLLPAPPPPAAPVIAQPIEQDLDWEPLVTYAYSSHLPVPPLPFPDQPAIPPARDPPTRR